MDAVWREGVRECVVASRIGKRQVDRRALTELSAPALHLGHCHAVVGGGHTFATEKLATCELANMFISAGVLPCDVHQCAHTVPQLPPSTAATVHCCCQFFGCGRETRGNRVRVSTVVSGSLSATDECLYPSKTTLSWHADCTALLKQNFII